MVLFDISTINGADKVLAASATNRIQELMRTWDKTVESALICSGFDPRKLDTLLELPQQIIYEESVGDYLGKEKEVICREVKYKNIVIARLSRKNYVYNSEGFVNPGLFE